MLKPGLPCTLQHPRLLVKSEADYYPWHLFTLNSVSVGCEFINMPPNKEPITPKEFTTLKPLLNLI